MRKTETAEKMLRKQNRAYIQIEQEIQTIAGMFCDVNSFSQN